MLADAGRLAELREAYPAVDVPGEVRRAAQWLIDNPKKRKRDMRRYFGNWLNRQQDRGGGQPDRKARPGDPRYTSFQGGGDNMPF